MKIFALLVLVVTAHSTVAEESGGTDTACAVMIPYKSWFFTAPATTVVGFPLRGKSARIDGYDRLGSYIRMRAKGVVRFFQENDNLLHSEDSLQFYYDPNESKISSTELFPVDSFSVTKGNMIYLWARDSMALSTQEQTLCTSIPWESHEENSQRVYGHGTIGLSYYDHVSSWVRVESDAIRELLKKSAVLVASQQVSTEKKLTEVTRYEYDLVVSDIRVERRWVDFSDWSCHVVISVPLQAMEGVATPQGLTDSALHTSEDVSPVSVGSAEWHLWYHQEQKKQLRKVQLEKERELHKYKAEKSKSFRAFQKEYPDSLQ